MVLSNKNGSIRDCVVNNLSRAQSGSDFPDQKKEKLSLKFGGEIFDGGRVYLYLNKYWRLQRNHKMQKLELKRRTKIHSVKWR